MSQRTLSYTEISTALSCPAQWDFRYGGRLAGSTLKRKLLAPKLSDGRAWGAAAAAWHANSDKLPPLAAMYAHQALESTLVNEVRELRELGLIVDLEQKVAQRDRIGAVLDHYMATAEPLGNLTRLEGELNVLILSRTGRRGSNRYRFQFFMDGYTVNEHGRPLVVEFKFRDDLTDVAQIERDRQPRWGAWALRRALSIRGPIGVLIDERVSYAPNPPKVVWAKNRKDRVPSTDKDQRTTPALYRSVCEEYSVEPDPAMLEVLGQRRWQLRTPLLFNSEELDDAGRDLVSAARRIHALDSGQEWPVRNARPALCRSCSFRQICAHPNDRLYVESLFTRGLPKRDRGPEPERSRTVPFEQLADLEEAA